MTIALDANLGNNHSNPSATSLALTTANPVAVGGTIFFLAAWFVASGTLTSITGPLTCTIDKQVKNGSVGVALVRAYAASGLAGSSVFTANYSASSASLAIAATSFTGIDSASPLDGVPVTATSSATHWTGGAITTSNANDIIVGVCMGDDGSDTTETPDSGWTEAQDFNSAGNGDSFAMVYQIVSATGTYTPGGTWGVTNANAGAAAAYMQASAGGTVPDIAAPTFNAIPFMGGVLSSP